MADDKEIANAQANLAAATTVFNAAQGGIDAVSHIEFKDRFGPLEAARVALNTAVEASLHAIREAEKILTEGDKEAS